MAARRMGGNDWKKTIPRQIIKEDAQYVCCPRRKRALFNKASEQALLTGAQVAVVIFMPDSKAFSFDHSSIDTVFKHFRAGDDAEVQSAAADNWLLTLRPQHGEMLTDLAEQKKHADDALPRSMPRGTILRHGWTQVRATCGMRTWRPLPPF